MFQNLHLHLHPASLLVWSEVCFCTPVITPNSDVTVAWSVKLNHWKLATARFSGGGVQILFKATIFRTSLVVCSDAPNHICIHHFLNSDLLWIPTVLSRKPATLDYWHMFTFGHKGRSGMSLLPQNSWTGVQGWWFGQRCVWMIWLDCAFCPISYPQSTNGF